MIKLKLVTGLFILILISFSFSPKEQPNIVLIMADDLGGRDLPVYGNSFNESPNLDKLASEGMIFTNAYAAPVCSPTRASIQSGQYPARVGIFDFIPGHWRPYEEVTVPHHAVQHLPDEIITLGETMQKSGYETAYFGKWHLGNNKEHLPNARGYDEAHIYAGGGFYAPRFLPEYIAPENLPLSEILTHMGIEFIQENKNKPFFLFISHYDVHVQLDADRDLINKYLKKEKSLDYPGNAVYAAMIEHIDKSVGTIMQTIDELGIAENTVFIFFSDNGGLDQRFDRVPMIIRWPGKIMQGTHSEAIVSSVDFYPTFIELAGGVKPKSQVLDGFSLLPALTMNKFDPEREVFTHYPVYHHEQPMSAVRKGDWKIVENLVTGEFALYNLIYGVNEMSDLMFSFPDKFSDMQRVLKEWQDKTHAQMPVSNPDFDPNKRYEWGQNPYR